MHKPSNNPVRIGPFRLIEPVARGGMAQVWKGVHEDSGVAIAFKVMTAALAREDRFRTLFRNEVRAMARLAHPGIALVLDYGDVDEATANLDQRLVRGSPWLVMEWASGGSLSSTKALPAWLELRGILLALLDALAHAHARGVVHRDVKPGNVMICTADDARPGLKLTDFGIAQPLDALPAGNTTSGTAQYMAPEQITGEWRDQGPWTDLYGLGCVAYRLSHGAPPFRAYKGDAIQRAHLTEAPPELRPQRPVPKGFDGWVARLLAKSVHARFRNAADAAWELTQLGIPEGEDDEDDDITRSGTRDYQPTTLSGVRRRPTAPVGQAATTEPVAARRASLDRLGDSAPGPFRPPGPSRPGSPRAPLPLSWDRPSKNPHAGLTGAGLGLYGLRNFGIVGRKVERDALWTALRKVRELRKTEIVIVDGPAGIGKSRLVEWIAQRAVEVGGATVLKAVGDPSGGSGLLRMVERVVRCAGLEHDQILARVAALFGDPPDQPGSDARALAAWMSPSVARVAEEPNERYALLERLLARIGTERPVILWLDDAAEAPDAIGFARHLHEARDLPVLICITMRSESVTQVAREAESRVLELLRLPRTARVALGPLSRQESHELVTELLVLDETLAARIEDRIAGNPLFAIQLVGDMVQRGLLVQGPRGFRVRPGESPALPDGLHEVWTSRVNRLLIGLPSDARGWLERAAVLGAEVDGDEWDEVCGYGAMLGKKQHSQKDILAWQATSEVLSVIVERLSQLRLIDEDDDGWSFRDPVLRESLERGARDGGRLVGHHEACAEMLRRRVALRRPRSSERLGRHLFAAGRFEAALTPLRDGARELAAAAGHRAAIALLGVYEEALNALNTDAWDPRWGQLALDRADLAFRSGELQLGLIETERILAAAHTFGWDEVARAALVLRARALLLIRGPDEAASVAVELLGLARKAKDGLREIEALQTLASIEASRHRPEAAIDLAQEAVNKARAAGLPLETASALRALGTHATQAGRQDRAREALHEAINAAGGIGAKALLANCLTSLGHAERLAGDIRAAQDAYSRAEGLMLELGGGNVVIPRHYLAVLAAQRGDFAGARSMLDPLVDRLELQGWRALLRGTLAVLVECASCQRDGKGFDTYAAYLTDLVTEPGALDPEAPEALERAAIAAELRGDRKRRDTALALAATMWERIGDTAAVSRVQARIGRR